MMKAMGFLWSYSFFGELVGHQGPPFDGDDGDDGDDGGCHDNALILMRFAGSLSFMGKRKLRSVKPKVYPSNRRISNFHVTILVVQYG